jgi:hypothetical protein
MESLNMTLRKVIKTRASFPNGRSALKLIYLGLIQEKRPLAQSRKHYRPAYTQTIQPELLSERPVVLHARTSIDVQFSFPFAGSSTGIGVSVSV